MPATHEVDDQARIIITRWRGEANDQFLLDALQHYQAYYQNNDDCLEYDEVVDFRDVPVSHITLKGLKQIGRLAAQTNPARPHTRIAFIVSNSLAMSLARIYASYRNFGSRHRKLIRAFRREEEARAWLCEPRQE
jgi:hypothetical protein